MTILAFDTTADICSAALCHKGETAVTSQETQGGRGAPASASMAAILVPILQGLLKQKSLEFKQVETLCVTRGPGSFTGIRIGLATAQGLKLANNHTIFAPTNFEVIAHALTLEHPDQHNSLILLDTKRDSYYVAEATKGSVNLKSATILTPQDIQERLAVDSRLMLAGDGQAWPDRYLSLERAIAEHLVNLYQASLETPGKSGHNELKPYYLHDPEFVKVDKKT